MKVKCTKNSNGNSNFEVGNEYELRKNDDGYFGDYIVSCEFIHTFIDKELFDKDVTKVNIGDTLHFACCDFERIS